jgi:prepilin-type N-terminal cleavage/methylation domain-containing protein
LKKTQGFTLIEVMVAAILFAGTMLYGIAFFSFGQKPVASTQETNFALQIAEDDMEQVKILGMANVVAIPDPGENQTSDSGIVFNLTRTTQIQASPYDGSTLVKSIVTWNSPGAGMALKKVSLATVVSYKFPGPPWQP